MTVDELESHIFALDAEGKARLFKIFVPSPTFVCPGIEKTPGVCGGDARIAGACIPVWLLKSWRRLGLNEQAILENYPRLTANDLANAWTYVRDHLDEIETAINEHARA